MQRLRGRGLCACGGARSEDLRTLDRCRGGLIIPRRVKDTPADPGGHCRPAQARRWHCSRFAPEDGRLSVHPGRGWIGGKLRSLSAASRMRPTRLTHASRPVWTPALPRRGYGSAGAVRRAVTEHHFCQNPGRQARGDTRPAQRQPARRRGHEPQRKPYAPEQVGVTFVPSAAWQRDGHGEPQAAPPLAPCRVRQARSLHRIHTAARIVRAGLRQGRAWPIAVSLASSPPRRRAASWTLGTQQDWSCAAPACVTDGPTDLR